jgi:hypothetical protein
MSGNLLRTLEDEAEQLARVNASLRADVAGLERAARAKDAALMAQAAELDELRLQHEGAAHAAEQRRAELERGDPKLRAHAAALAKQLRAKDAALTAQAAELEALRAARDDALRAARDNAERLRGRDGELRQAAQDRAAVEAAADALEGRLRTVDARSDARVADWITERRRLQAELRREKEAGEALRRADANQRKRAAKLQERLDALAAALRAAPPSPRKATAAAAAASSSPPQLPVRHLSPADALGPPPRAPAPQPPAGGDASGGPSELEWVPLVEHDQLLREQKVLHRRLAQAELAAAAAEAHAKTLAQRLERAERCVATANGNVAAARRPASAAAAARPKPPAAAATPRAAFTPAAAPRPSPAPKPALPVSWRR